MEYLCPCCNETLVNENNNYKCINQKCDIRNSSLIIDEGWHDVTVIDEETEEVKIGKKWCTMYAIKNKI